MASGQLQCKWRLLTPGLHRMRFVGHAIPIHSHDTWRVLRAICEHSWTPRHTERPYTTERLNMSPGAGWSTRTPRKINFVPQVQWHQRVRESRFRVPAIAFSIGIVIMIDAQGRASGVRLNPGPTGSVQPTLTSD